jgi:hypothetical protein
MHGVLWSDVSELVCANVGGKSVVALQVGEPHVMMRYTNQAFWTRVGCSLTVKARVGGSRIFYEKSSCEMYKLRAIQ